MRLKWLVISVVLLFLLSWTSVFAGPRDNCGHGDDDIPELMKPKTGISVEKIFDSLVVESLWNAIFSADQERQLELSNQQDAKSVRLPATRRYPVRFK
jgi:hypothetical protein